MYAKISDLYNEEPISKAVTARVAVPDPIEKPNPDPDPGTRFSHYFYFIFFKSFRIIQIQLLF